MINYILRDNARTYLSSEKIVIRFCFACLCSCLTVGSSLDGENNEFYFFPFRLFACFFWFLVEG